jgi:hypothetical protein
VILHNARQKDVCLDVQGYELLPSLFSPFLDDSIHKLTYEDPAGFAKLIFPQAEACILNHIPGASRVLCFDHIVRDGDRKKHETTGKKEVTHHRVVCFYFTFDGTCPVFLREMSSLFWVGP